jgi:hypothetical protein
MLAQREVCTIRAPAVLLASDPVEDTRVASYSGENLFFPFSLFFNSSFLFLIVLLTRVASSTLNSGEKGDVVKIC